MGSVQGTAMKIDPNFKRDAPAHLHGRGAFTVHGHRLSSLYRPARQNLNPFIVLKILKESAENLWRLLSIYRAVKPGGR